MRNTTTQALALTIYFGSKFTVADITAVLAALFGLETWTDKNHFSDTLPTNLAVFAPFSDIYGIGIRVTVPLRVAFDPRIRQAYRVDTPTGTATVFAEFVNTDSDTYTDSVQLPPTYKDNATSVAYRMWQACKWNKKGVTYTTRQMLMNATTQRPLTQLGHRLLSSK